MDPILLVIADTLLFAWAWRQREPPLSPLAGTLPHYQRRTQACLILVLLCQAVASWLVARHAGLARLQVGGLLLLDVTSLTGLALACGALQRTASRGSVSLVGLGLGLWAASLGFLWLLVVLAGTSAPGAALIASVAEAWGTTPGTLGMVALFHYGLAAWLLAAGIASRDHFPALPAWNHDRAFRPVALLASLSAVAYALFTLRLL